MKYFAILFYFVFTFFTFSATAQVVQRAGELDPTFGNYRNGIVLDSLPDTDRCYCTSIAIQDDGKIVLGGYTVSSPHNIFNIILLRLDTNGLLDSAFGNNGIITTHIGPSYYECTLFDLKIKPNGKILAIGTSENKSAIIQYNANGTLDSSFARQGIDTIAIWDESVPVALTLLSNGKMLIAGQIFPLFGGLYYAFVARLDSAGKIDSSFGSYGLDINHSFFSFYSTIGVQNDGKILAAGTYGFTFGQYDTTSNLLDRYNVNGSVDTTFDTSSVFLDYTAVNEISDVMQLPDGKILAVGYGGSESTANFVLARMDTNGILDDSFGVGGVAVGATGYTCASFLQPDGKIVVVGVANLERFNSNGSPDATFGTNGVVTIDIKNADQPSPSCMARQNNGEIVVAGQTLIPACYFAARLFDTTIIATGILNFSAAPNSLIIYPNPVNNIATLNYTLATDESININLCDVTGRVIETVISNNNELKGSYKQTLNLQSLTPGTYIISITNSANETQTIKIVKQ
jgi:uncharacterized delta-60 repeat protein